MSNDGSFHPISSPFFGFFRANWEMVRVCARVINVASDWRILTRQSSLKLITAVLEIKKKTKEKTSTERLKNSPTQLVSIALKWKGNLR